MNQSSSESIIRAELDWDEYFMSLAVVASKRSKDRETKVGAVVVSTDKKVLGIGWNGHPKIESGENQGKNDHLFTWEKIIEDYERNKHLYVCHAVLNAIMHSSGSLKGATIYVTLNPSNECAKVIVQSGVKKVIYMEEDIIANSLFQDRKEKILKAAAEIFGKCEVKIVQFKDVMAEKLERAYDPRTIEVKLE